MHRMALAVWTAAVLTLGALAQAQPSETASLINQQLDRQTKLQLTGTLPEAMAQIGKQTGVPVQADASVWEMLPWGRETVVNARIENQTLRQALDAITRKLGLKYALKDEAVELQPLPALKRLARKSTVAELEAVNLMAGTSMDLKKDSVTLKDLVEAIDARLEAIKAPVAIENRSATSPDRVAQDALVAVPRNATIVEALDAIDRSAAGATWFPWGKSIVVLPKSDATRLMLEKQVALRYDNQDVAQVLGDLSRRAGVKFDYEPGSLSELPTQARAIRLVLDASAIEALEAISGTTGLAYQVKDDSVYIWNTARASNTQRDRGVALIQTEFGQIIVSESQCPPDVKEFIDFQKQKFYENARKLMAEQGFKPKSPATRPAATKPAAPKPADATVPPGKDL